MKINVKCGCGNEININKSGEIKADDYESNLLKISIGKWETVIKCDNCGDGIKIV